MKGVSLFKNDRNDAHQNSFMPEIVLHDNPILHRTSNRNAACSWMKTIDMNHRK